MDHEPINFQAEREKLHMEIHLKINIQSFEYNSAKITKFASNYLRALEIFSAPHDQYKTITIRLSEA